MSSIKSSRCQIHFASVADPGGRFTGSVDSVSLPLSELCINKLFYGRKLLFQSSEAMIFAVMNAILAIV